MKTESRKLSIIDWIIKLDDDTMLNQIEMLQNSDEENWTALSKNEKVAIEEGLQQLNRGEKISHAEVMSEFREKYTT